MARKRMFDSEIINQDSFLDLPMESKALYFLLGMEADDEGFVSPKRVLRLHGGNKDSLSILIAKNFIIPFESGVVVITDWKRNNYLNKNKIKETIYQNEKKQIVFNLDTEKYELLNPSNAKGLTKVKPELNQSLNKVKPKFNEVLTSIEENRVEENRREENRVVVAGDSCVDGLKVSDSCDDGLPVNDSCVDGLQTITDFYNANIRSINPIWIRNTK